MMDVSNFDPFLINYCLTRTFGTDWTNGLDYWTGPDNLTGVLHWNIELDWTNDLYYSTKVLKKRLLGWTIGWQTIAPDYCTELLNQTIELD